jgi:hypothetical protein
MPTARRKPLHVNLGWAVALLFVLSGGYLMSYAPVVWYAEKTGLATPKKPFDIIDGGELPLYQPVDALIDSTPLRRPLFTWARTWGVGDTFVAARRLRTGTESE